MMKRILSLTLALVMLVTLAVPLSVSATETASTEKAIDLYLIAGQSNAAGTTKISDASAAYEWAPELRNGYSNIRYAGVSGSSSKEFKTEWTNAKLGLGIYNTTRQYIGPEAGMAKALSAKYNAETGKEAGIIKYAVGGSSLLNKTTGDAPHSKAGLGNWAPPSYVEANVTTDGKLNGQDVVEGLTSNLYYSFVAQVKESVTALVEEGYTTFNICGLYWMQGCNNRSYPDAYKEAFKCFATDIRGDIAATMTEVAGADCGGASMPIVVGTISQTYALTCASCENINIKFIQMQKALPDTVENCYIVDNSQFVVSAFNEADPKNPIPYGSGDYSHWNQEDALTIGKNVGDKLLEISDFERSYQYVDLIEIDMDAWETKLAGTATEFEIGTASELLSLFRYLNSLSSNAATLTTGKTFKLTADIDLNPGVDWEQYNASPSGYEGKRPANMWISAQFAGTFDGQGHSITGMWVENFVRNATSHTVNTNDGVVTITHGKMNSLGMFYLPKGGTTIQNLVLDGGRFHDAGNLDGLSVGALVGCVSNAGTFTISNCYVGENFVLDQSSAQVTGNPGISYGGIIGSNYASGTTKTQTLNISNVVFDGKLITYNVQNSTKLNFGYFIGKSQGDYLTISVTDCMFTGELLGVCRQDAVDSLAKGTYTNSKSAITETNAYISQPTTAEEGKTKDTVAYGILPSDLAKMMEEYYARAPYSLLIDIDTGKWYANLSSSTKTFEIGTASEFMSLFRYLNWRGSDAATLTSGKTFKLTADIDLNHGVDWAKYNADPENYTGKRPANLWISSHFSGTLDGNGHSITGMWCEDYARGKTSHTIQTENGTKTISYADVTSLGLVSMARDGTNIQNLVLGGGRFSTAKNEGTKGMNVGSLIGCASQKGSISVQNCYIGSDFTVAAVNDTLTGSSAISYGGVIGSNYSSNGAQTLTVENVVFDGTVVSPSLSNHEFGYLIGKTYGGSSNQLTFTVKNCMFTGVLKGERAGEVNPSLLHGTKNSSASYIGREELNNYTAQPDSVGDDVYLAKHSTYGVLPVAVADMLSEYYVQDDGTDSARILSEINSLGWLKVGYDVVITRDSDGKSLTVSEWTQTVYTTVLADGETVTVDTLTDTEGVALYGMVLNNLSAGVTYTVTLTPKWMDADENVVIGATRVGTVLIPVAE